MSIQDNFPQRSVEKIHGEPNYATLHQLNKTLRANASSVPSTLGGGAHGLLGLLLPAADYFALTANNSCKL